MNSLPPKIDAVSSARLRKKDIFIERKKKKKNANLRSGPKTKRASEELDDIL